MKHLAFFIFSLFALQTLHAQAIAIDSSFAQNGYLKTRLGTIASYSAIMDITPENHIVLLGYYINYQTGLLFCTYDMNGDSVQGYHFPTNFNNQFAFQSIKSLNDGSFLTTDYQKGKGLKHIYQDGAQDMDFGTDGGAPLFFVSIQDMLISQDNRILLAGQNLNNYPEENALAGAYVLAYHMNGQLDTTFADHGVFRYHHSKYEFFNKMLEQPDGKFLAAGCAVLNNNQPGFSTLVRLLPNGARDSTFGVDGLIMEHVSSGGEHFGMALQSDQKILVCGFDNGLNAAVVIRYLPDGSRDESFGANGVVVLYSLDEATEMLVLPNGKILVYGSLPNGNHRSAFVQLLPDGSLDPYFGFGGVFYGPHTQFKPPMKMRLVDGNKIIATGSISINTGNAISTTLQVQGFLLNLNVGTVTPQNEPSVWAYPNPVHNAFEVGFTLESAEQIQFDLYDLQGKLVQSVLGNTAFEAGAHTVPVQLTDGLAAGNYMLRLSVAGKAAVVVRMLKV